MARIRVTSGLVILLVLASCTPGEAPKNPVEHAHTLASSGDLEGAVWTLHRAIQDTPDNAELRTELGRLQLANGKPVAAESAFERALADGADAERILPLLGDALIEQQRYDDLLERLPVDGTESWLLQAQLYLLRGYAHEQLSEDKAAMRDYLDALETREQLPGDAENRVVLDQRVARALRDGRLMVGADQHHFCATRMLPEATLPAPPTPRASSGRVFEVGPGRQYKRPSEVADLVEDGDTVAIDATDFQGDVAVWRANGLLLKGIGGMVRLDAGGQAAEEKAIWVIKGDDTVVDNIEFSGARVVHKNGAGIRQEGTNLTVRNSVFRDNENGILAGSDPESHIYVIDSEFADNGHGDGYSHNLYIGRVGRLTFVNNFSHGAHIGHQLKSRASTNEILYNHLSDGSDGRSSYLIDLPDGGSASIVGNLLYKGPDAENPNMIAFAAEQNEPADNHLHVINNSAYNSYLDAVFVNVHAKSDVLVANNLLAGAPASLLLGDGRRTANHVGPGHGLADPSGGDFRLKAGSAAIDTGADPKNFGLHMLPAFEHGFPEAVKTRREVWKTDIGAFEYCEINTATD